MNLMNPSMAMILNLSIGEEVEQDAKELEGKTPKDLDAISTFESHHEIAEPEKVIPKEVESVV
jgi:hypothetical protein